jgi:hypothetical protein
MELFQEVRALLSMNPLEKALRKNDLRAVQRAVENGSDLNEKGNPSFLIAVRYCNEDIIRYLARCGANIHAVNNVKSDAFTEALNGGKIENLPLIHELGHSVPKYGGQTFRQAVASRLFRALEFFLANGVDINYHEPDMVYPSCSTALCVASRYTDLNMVRFLVENGADVLLAEKDGARPYTIALEKSDWAMADYLKTKEPPELHSLEAKLTVLKRYDVPSSLVAFLKGSQLRLQLPEGCNIPYIDFLALEDTVEIKRGKQKLLRISKTTGEYSDILFVWHSSTRKVAFWDIEHDRFGDLAPFDMFITKPEAYVAKIFNCN